MIKAEVVIVWFVLLYGKMSHKLYLEWIISHTGGNKYNNLLIAPSICTWCIERYLTLNISMKGVKHINERCNNVRYLAKSYRNNEHLMISLNPGIQYRYRNVTIKCDLAS